jgi:hypothetical protein
MCSEKLQLNSLKKIAIKSADALGESQKFSSEFMQILMIRVILMGLHIPTGASLLIFYKNIENQKNTTSNLAYRNV